MDAWAVAGGYGRWLIFEKLPGYRHKKAEEMAGKAFQRGGRGASFFVFGCLGPLHLPSR
jgi:hypothetical protein